MAPHPHDIPQAYIDEALATAEYPSLLLELIACSRRVFGLHTPHFPHTINYPWAAARLMKLASGARLLDVGAGVAPLPIYFAERGYEVDCVDSNDVTRTLPAGPEWNEWGFFDYGAVHPRIRAYNMPVTAFEPRHTYDAVYSISVIAHMPSAVRRETFALARRWLKPGGLLALAIDLIPDTDYLWNKGGSGEEPAEHGTYRQVEDELRSAGFAISESHMLRNVPHSRTDLYFCVATAGGA